MATPHLCQSLRPSWLTGAHRIDRWFRNWSSHCACGSDSPLLFSMSPQGFVIFILKVNAIFFQNRLGGHRPCSSPNFCGPSDVGSQGLRWQRAKETGGWIFRSRVGMCFGRHLQNTENVPTDITPISRRGLSGSPKGAIAVGDRGIESPVEFPGRFEKHGYTAGDVPVRCQVPGKPLPEKTPATWPWRKTPEDGLQPTGQCIDAVQLCCGFIYERIR